MATLTTQSPVRMRKPATVGKIVLAILTLLTVAAIASAVYRLVVGLGESTNLSDARPWGLWIGFDFSLIALSGAGFTVAAIVHILNLKQFRPILRASVLTGLLGYASVLVILLLDLGRPDRFWGFLVFWNAHSPLFEISWCVLLYTTILVIEFAPILFERLNKPKIVKALHKATIPVVIAGVTLSTLHQSTLGTLYLTLPHTMNRLWWTWVLPVVFYISSIGIGLAVMIFVWIVGSKVFGRKVELNIIQGLAKGFVGIAIVYLVIRFGDLWFTGDLPAVFSLTNFSGWFWIEVLMALIVPLVIYANKKWRQSETALLLMSISIIIGGFLNRFNAVLTAQAVNRYTIPAITETFSYTPSLIEWILQIGVVAGVVLLWYLAALYLPIFPEAVQESH